MKLLITALLVAMFVAHPVVAAPATLLKVDESGNVQAGSYANVAKAVAAGSRINVVYARPSRVINRTCSSVIDLTSDGTAHCFIVDAFDTTDMLGFASPVAFEYIIVSTEGYRQTVKSDLSGKQLPFQGGNCDGQMICVDQIAVTWFAVD